jgi:hypothetical protein
MKLSITKASKIRDLQEKFTAVYPFLKIEFYKHPHEKNQLSVRKDRISPQKVISKIGRYSKADQIDIDGNRTVAELEHEFYEKFGIAMQVSRRTRNVWIETSLTDNRTLEMQNKQGEESSIPLAEM